ncbi:VOC family protein [Kitasatospora sp. NPDC127111]|uniref:VOC family protein n=1 Tax=Kitasatospora sp. NPDC127111 TaxID=3345363 RepID=UPI003625A07E
MGMHIDLIGLVVADMGRALAFYRDLGLAIPADADREPHVEVVLPGGLRLAWDRADVVRGFDPGWTPPSGGARMGLALRCDGPAEVDEEYARMVGLGHRSRLEPWDAFWGQRYAQLQDPDGNPVDLFSPLD